MPDPFYFIDIPHTASSSIRSALGLYGTERHQPARLKRHDVGPEAWQEAFTFAFVRDPFERTAKMYLRRDLPMGFEEWLEARFVDEEQPTDTTAGRLYWMPQAEFVTDGDGELIVDYVGRFERLRHEWDVISEIIGVDKELPHENEMDYGVGWEGLYTTKAKRIVLSAYMDDFARFAYPRQPTKSWTPPTVARIPKYQVGKMSRGRQFTANGYTFWVVGASDDHWICQVK